MKPSYFLITAALLAPLAAAPAMAQGITTSALRGLDNKAPIDVDADRIDVLDQQNQAIFTGNVRVRQGNLTLEADRIKVAYSRPAKGDPVIQRLDADGNVRLATPSERATSRFGIYDVDKRILTLIGNVVLTQGTTKVQGNRLTIDLASGRSTLDGKTSTGQPGSRVSGRFAVPDRK
ncbi:lipopolysaccharide transport periplasmic protein LptA [Sandaracinobacter neustonicus]|uniref:Lipopolysaccharide transport periplasmic protein LptA n=2 Tax=Sandaracinobacter neustonicus TaxID=1715348 RepID=A0A501XEZ5_9SPHN|nr:lipopolysaccharide transport periplasmic protein LptA [Sandaracinobacter neustonicus]